MGYLDRRYDDNNSNGGGGMGRFLHASSSFFNWSLPLMTIPRWLPGLSGIHVRVHILYIIIAIGELVQAAGAEGAGLAFVGAMMGTLFLLVLLHEFGHCLACRLVGGDADEVLMWPLGGLAFCRPPHRWRPALITTLGGPGVNVLLVPILGGILLALGASMNTLVFDPLKPQSILREVFYAENWRIWLWAAYYMNFVLLAFNVLVPMYPMDSGRILQELLWSRLGYKRSMEIAVFVGLIAAVVLGLLGIATGQMRLVAVAVFGGMTCFNERQKLALIEDQPAWAYDTDKGHRGFDNAPIKPDRGVEKALLKQQARARDIQAQVDKVLDKIREKGIGSLSQREKDILQEATQRTRKNS